MLCQGCTTYLKARAKNISGTKVESHDGDLVAVPLVWSRGKAPD